MSMFNNRSGGSFYRYKALNGYIKLLYKKYFMNGSSEEPVGELENRMNAKYSIVNEGVKE